MGLAVPGDVAVSAGTVSYLGPFTAEFRGRVTEGWKVKLKELKVPHTFGNFPRPQLLILLLKNYLFTVARGRERW